MSEIASPELKAGLGSRWVGVLPAVVGAAAFCVGWVALDRWPPFPPTISDDWLVYIALVAAAAAVVEGVVGRAALTWPLRVLLLAGATAITLKGLVPHAMGWGALAGWTVGATALAAVTAGLLDALDRTGRPGVTGLGWTGGLGFAALMALFGDYMSVMLFYLPLIGVAALTAIAGLFSAKLALRYGGNTFFAVMLVALLVNGGFYATELPATYVPIVLLLCPAAAWAAMLPWWRRRRGLGFVAAFVAIAMPGAAVIVPPAIRYFQGLQESGYGY